MEKGRCIVKEAKIVKTCGCTNFGVVETGISDIGRGALGDSLEYCPIVQLWGPDGLIRYSNREPDEEMNDLEMVCIRCGKIARWEQLLTKGSGAIVLRCKRADSKS